jgi:diacylglycerol kinase (ATP)
MARALILYNPAARSAPEQALLKRIRKEFTLAGFEADIAASRRAGEIAALAAGAAGGAYDRLAVCGGDGSVREAAQGLSGSKLPLGVIPLGTANVLARELGLPVESTLSCAAIAARGRALNVGLGRVGGAVFTFCASVGLDSAAVAGVDLGIKRQTGSWAYVYSALRAALQPPLPLLTVRRPDGSSFTAGQVFAARMSRYGAGFICLTRSASLSSPYLRLIAVSPPVALRLPSMIVRMLAGGLEGAPGVLAEDVESFTVEAAEPCPVQADGDILASTPATFESLPDALRVIVPKD